MISSFKQRSGGKQKKSRHVKTGWPSSVDESCGKLSISHLLPSSSSLTHWTPMSLDSILRRLKTVQLRKDDGTHKKDYLSNQQTNVRE